MYESGQSTASKRYGFRRRSDASEDDTDQLKTTILRCNVMSELVKDLPCTLCGCDTLVIRPVDCNLGLVCQLQTYCTLCETAINSTYSSDRLGGLTSSNAPFVVTRSVVSATMDMGVGYSGITKLSRHLNMNGMCRDTYMRHVKAITDAYVETITTVVDDAKKAATP